MHRRGDPVFGAARPSSLSRFLGAGELIRLIGEVESIGMKAPREIASYVMKAKQLDETDKALVRRIRWGVTDRRKRMAAKGA